MREVASLIPSGALFFENIEFACLIVSLYKTSLRPKHKTNVAFMWRYFQSVSEMGFMVFY